MVSLFAFVAYIGAAIAASIGAMYGLSFLSVVAHAVLGAYIGMFVVALIAYTIRS